MTNLSLDWLTLLVVAPLLAWGLWIVSEESFDELNSHYSVGSKFLRKFDFARRSEFETLKLENSRNLRKRLLPLYFVCIVTISLLLYFVVVQKPSLLTPLH